MTGSLHEKNGKWQLVLYGAVGILFPDKKSENDVRFVKMNYFLAYLL